MSVIDDIQEDLYWNRVERGMIIATRLCKAQERLERVAAHEQWEKHWRTRLAKVLRQMADVVEKGRGEEK